MVRPYLRLLVLLLYLVVRTGFLGTVLIIGFYVLYLAHVNYTTWYSIAFTYLLVFLILSTGINFLLLSTGTYLIFNIFSNILLELLCEPPTSTLNTIC